MSSIDSATGAASTAVAAIREGLRVRQVPAMSAIAMTASEAAGELSPNTRIQPDAPMTSAVSGLSRGWVVNTAYACCGANAATVRFGNALTVA